MLNKILRNVKLSGLLVILLVPLDSFGKTAAPAKKPSLGVSLSAAVKNISIKIIHGSLVTDITLAPAKDFTLATMKNNRGVNIKQNLEKTDFSYAQRQFYLDKNPGHAACAKSHVEITYANAAGKPLVSASVCYREKDALSKKWTESVETLAKVIRFRPKI